jgi:CubicO group peptidase (beta-lactamase class C family)
MIGPHACLAWMLLAAPPSAHAPSLPPPDGGAAALAAELDDYLTRCSAFGFSGVVLVAKAGEVVLCKGYGPADRARGTPFSADTAVDIGSLAKQFTAAAIVKLEAEGKLRVEDPLALHLAGVPADKRAITLDQLLTHTSGLERGEGDRSEALSRDEMVARILATPLVAAVGTRFSYSNWGYTLLAAVVERASGRTFHSYLREQLFDPLGMSRTGFYGDASRWPRGSVAHAYFETAEEGCPVDRPLTWHATGSGFVITTAPDLLRWERELRDGRLLTPEAKAKLFSGYVRADGPFEYGYGWHVGSAPGARLAFHAGYYKGSACEYRRYIDQDVATFVATNVGYLGGNCQQAISEPVARLALGREQPMPPPVIRLDERALERCCGEYRLPSGSRFEVRAEQGRLRIAARGQEALDALHYPDREAPDSTLPNASTEGVIEALRSGSTELLASSLHADDVDAYAAMLGEAWRELHERFGALEGYGVLGTAPYPFSDEGVRTYVELAFERETVIVTIGFRDGRLFDLSTWEGASDPGALALAPLSAETFTTYDLWAGKGTAVEFRARSDGTVGEMILHAHGQDVHAARAP